jgi:hypothetical protein
LRLKRGFKVIFEICFKFRGEERWRVREKEGGKREREGKEKGREKREGREKNDRTTGGKGKSTRTEK